MRRSDINLQLGTKHDPFDTAPTGPYSHGQYGIFNMPASLRTLYSAVIKPSPGLANDLPVLDGTLSVFMDGYNVENAATTLVTGVTAGTADDVDNQPTTKCAEPPEGGLLKLCTIANPLGKFWAGTPPISITDLGSIKHIGEPTGFQLANSFQTQSPLAPSSPVGTNLEVEINKRVQLMLLSFQRMICPRTYIADPVNSAASNNWKDFMGLDMWINQNNKRDMYTSNLCTAANSVIFDANYTNIADDPETIFGLIEETYAHIVHNATQSGLTPVLWKIVMSRHVFQVLCRYWPVIQHVHAINAMQQLIGAAGNGGVVNQEATSTLAMTNAMWDQKFLPIMGDNVPVILDDCIPEDDVTTNGNLQPGEFSSDIYFVPYTVLGGQPVTGWTFRQWNNIDSSAASQLGWNNFTFADGGRSLWMRMTKVDCFQIAVTVAPRLHMLTPQIAGRVQNVAYSPRLHFRSWDPNSQYFHNGGRTNTPAESYYNSWQATPAIIGDR